MPGKYMPLEKYLSSLAGSTREIALTVKRIEKIAGFTLPSSAYEDRRWWDHETEGNHVNKRAWANAGWKIANLDVKAKQAKFIRA